MSTSATHDLYSRDVLRLAMSLPHNDRLAHAQGSARCRAPMCGSEMDVDVMLMDGAITHIAIRAHACALGQASAAIVRENAIGGNAQDIGDAAMQVRAALAGQGKMPWAEFEPLAYARDYPARHGAILLPFETLLAAIGQAQT